jgi:hypothetical protein
MHRLLVVAALFAPACVATSRMAPVAPIQVAPAEPPPMFGP